ncbi:MAG: O-antigen ligase family protein [Burkholderiales bacterium]
MGPGLLAAVRSTADRTAQWAAIALGFSIPLSVALDNVLLAVVAAGWLASGAWADKWEAIRGNRVALAALALFGLLLAGTLYGERNPGDASLYLGKYLDLLFIPVFASVLREEPARRRALHALAAGLAVVLALSYLLRFGGIPRSDIFAVDASYAVVFKTRQTHNLLMALGAFLFARLALAASTRRLRLIWAALALLAAANVTLIVQGATGYLVLGALVLYLGYGFRGWWGLAWAIGAAAALVLALTLMPGPFQQRIAQIRSEISQWHPGTPTVASSVGTRLEFYRLTFGIAREHPLLGSGTGSFPKAYADATRGQAALPSRNPHNEYLHMTVQLGLVGLLALLYLFWSHWRLAPRLASPLESHLARGLLLTIAIGCLFNSLLLDHTEGLLYAWLTGVLFAGLQSPGKQ